MGKDIRNITIKAIEEMSQCIDSMPWENEEFYAQFLAQTYFYVRNATRVLAKAAYRCTHEEEPIHKNLIKSINEEKNHEIMATNDLLALGKNILDYKENPATTAYYSTLLSAIDFDGPYALFGYFVTLEGLGAIGADNLLARLNAKYSKKASQFLRVHIRVDEHHFTDGLNFIERLPADKRNTIIHHIEVSKQLYINLVHGVLLQSKQHQAGSVSRALGASKAQGAA